MKEDNAIEAILQELLAEHKKTNDFLEQFIKDTKEAQERMAKMNKLQQQQAAAMVGKLSPKVADMMKGFM